MKEFRDSPYLSKNITDRFLAEQIAHHVKPLRDDAAEARVEKSQVSYHHPFIKLQLSDKAKEKDIRATEKENLYLALHKVATDETIQNFLDIASYKAKKRGQVKTAEGISTFATSSPEAVLTREENDTTPVARAVAEIATIAGSENKTKKMYEFSGDTQPIYDYNPLQRSRMGEEYFKNKNIKEPNIIEVEDLYNLIGLEERVGSIPDIPGFSRFFGKVNVTQERIPQLGIDLSFAFYGPCENSLAEEVFLTPAYITISIKKREGK